MVGREVKEDTRSKEKLGTGVEKVNREDEGDEERDREGNGNGRRRRTRRIRRSKEEGAQHKMRRWKE